MTTHVLRTIQGTGRTLVMIDSFNDNNIMINTPAETVDTITYTSPLGAPASVPASSPLDLFLDLVAMNLYTYRLGHDTIPPPDPGQSVASIDQPSIAVSTGTNPDTTILKTRYLRTLNQRMTLVENTSHIDIYLDLPTHRGYHFSYPDNTDYEIPIDAYEEATAVRWCVEVDAYTTTGPTLVDGQKLINIPFLDADGSVVDEERVAYTASCDDNAFGAAIILHIEVAKSLLTGQWAIQTSRWDGGSWVPYNCHFYIRFVISNEPLS